MERLKSCKLFLFDMDGTLYLGSRLFDFTKELLRTIREAGGRYMFMTNNSSKSVAAYIEKLASLGIEAEYDDFMTSSQATAYYLKKNYRGKLLYVSGTQSLKEELIKENENNLLQCRLYDCPYILIHDSYDLDAIKEIL